CWRAVLKRQVWSDFGEICTPMTRVTRQFACSPEVAFIDSIPHQDPFSGRRRVLVVFGIPGPTALVVMAEFAALADRRRKEPHGRQELIFGNAFEYLNILVDVFGHQLLLSRGLWCGRLARICCLCTCNRAGRCD